MAPLRHTTAGYVYLLESGGYHKIGQAIDVQRRLRQLSLPHEPRLLWSLYVDDMNRAEKYLHQLFHHAHIRGEWFQLSADDVTWICGCSDIPYDRGPRKPAEPAIQRPIGRPKQMTPIQRSLEPDAKGFLTVIQVAGRLGISRQRVYQYIEAGRLTVSRVGLFQRLRIHISDFEDFARHRQ